MDLKSFIEDLRLSQREVADVLNCRPCHVSMIVAGKRNMTGMHVRLLIEKYGFDVVAKYADPAELPSSVVSVTAPVIHGNNNPVNGSGNQNITTPDSDLISVMKAQAAQITTLLQQQDRLITLLESKK